MSSWRERDPREERERTRVRTEPEGAMNKELSPSEGPTQGGNACESLLGRPGSVLQGVVNLAQICFTLLPLQHGERVKGESLGAGQQIRSGWVNCAHDETRGHFCRRGPKGMWGDRRQNCWPAVLRGLRNLYALRSLLAPFRLSDSSAQAPIHW